jgi:hypothetical protein
VSVQKGEKAFIHHFKIKEMTWKTYWTVIGIVYPTYYALIIGYDLYMYERRKKKETSILYEVSNLFESEIKPTVVSLELYEPKVFAEKPSTSVIEHDDYRQEVETESLTIDEFIIEVNKVNSRIVSDIYQ